MILYTQLISKKQSTATTSFPFTQKFTLNSVKKEKGKEEKVLKEMLILMVLDP